MAAATSVDTIDDYYFEMERLLLNQYQDALAVLKANEQMVYLSDLIAEYSTRKEAMSDLAESYVDRLLAADGDADIARPDNETGTTVGVIEDPLGATTLSAL